VDIAGLLVRHSEGEKEVEKEVETNESVAELLRGYVDKGELRHLRCGDCSDEVVNEVEDRVQGKSAAAVAIVADDKTSAHIRLLEDIKARVIQIENEVS
jgi:hypothetical protein